MTDTKLLPCPFCGREPTSTGREGSPKCDKPYVHFVACYCGGYSASAHHIGDGLTPEEAERTAIAAWNRRTAIAAWNRRAQLDLRVAELSAEVERLRKDAARYRWLRQPNALQREAHIAVLTRNGGFVATGELADTNIDAAMQGDNTALSGADRAAGKNETPGSAST